MRTRNIFPPPGFKTKQTWWHQHYPLASKIMKSLAAHDQFVIRASGCIVRKCRSWCSFDELRLNARASLSYHPNCPLFNLAGPIWAQKGFQLAWFCIWKGTAQTENVFHGYIFFLTEMNAQKTGNRHISSKSSDRRCMSLFTLVYENKCLAMSSETLLLLKIRVIQRECTNTFQASGSSPPSFSLWACGGNTNHTTASLESGGEAELTAFNYACCLISFSSQQNN